MPPSPFFVDVDALLSAPHKNGSAASISYSERAELEEARKKRQDPEAAEGTFLNPDWGRIAQRAQDILRNTSMDLGVAARLTEALFQQHGFAALPEGFQLLRRLVAEYWDRIAPPLDESGDMEARASALSWLCNPVRGACFPGTLRYHPLFPGRDRSYCLIDWQNAQKGNPSIDREDLEKAIGRLPLNDCERLAEDMTRAFDELGQLGQALQQQMGTEAPDAEELRQALRECLQLVRQVLSRKQPTIPTPEPACLGELEDGQPDDRISFAGTPATRAEAYRQLSQAAAVLRALEPHSPIPYLVQRAVELGAKPFPELIRELVREPNILAELNRELGIKGEKSTE